MARKKSASSSTRSRSSKPAARAQKAASGELSRALAQIKALQKQVKTLQRQTAKARPPPKARQTAPKGIKPIGASPTAAQSARAVKALLQAATQPVQAAVSAVAAVARFVLQDKKLRTYLDTTTGETITRRQRVIRQTGKNPEQLRRDNLYQLAAARSTPEGRDKYREVRDRRGRRAAFQKAYHKLEAERLGILPSQVRVRGDSEQAQAFRAAMREVERLRPLVRMGGGTRAQKHEYLKALHALGVISDAALKGWRQWSGSD